MMHSIMHAIFVDRVFTPQNEIADAVILIDGRKISAVGARNRIAIPPSALCRDARGLTAVPGFVDLHVHGAAGHDMMEGAPKALAAITAALARHGTTSLVATTVTASEESTRHAIAACAAYMHSSAQPAPGTGPQAEILGVHLEGPFISSLRRGVHPLEWVVPPSVQLFQRLLAAGKSTVCILTLAPELPGALDLIDAARANDVLVSMGHTDASYAEAMRAIDRGARHAAHVFNAMRPFAHRDTGVVGAVLTAPSVMAELIADGVHVDAAAMRILLAAKGLGGIILVSDGTAATGMPDGTYRLGTLEVTVSNGVSRSADGKLAGSTLTLDRALRNVIALGVPFAYALSMLTANPARALGLGGRKGTLAPGADADLIFLDAQNEVAGVMTRGVGWPDG